jgi:hypothetical protein
MKLFSQRSIVIPCSITQTSRKIKRNKVGETVDRVTQDSDEGLSRYDGEKKYLKGNILSKAFLELSINRSILKNRFGRYNSFRRRLHQRPKKYKTLVIYAISGIPLKLR